MIFNFNNDNCISIYEACELMSASNESLVYESYVIKEYVMASDIAGFNSKVADGRRYIVIDKIKGKHVARMKVSAPGKFIKQNNHNEYISLYMDKNRVESEGSISSINMSTHEYQLYEDLFKRNYNLLKLNGSNHISDNINAIDVDTAFIHDEKLLYYIKTNLNNKSLIKLFERLPDGKLVVYNKNNKILFSSNLKIGDIIYTDQYNGYYALAEYLDFMKNNNLDYRLLESSINKYKPNYL